MTSLWVGASLGFALAGTVSLGINAMRHTGRGFAYAWFILAGIFGILALLTG